ncbi:MAG TPA: rhomboid family intramembrane serine protease [Chitinophagaceae bacterium]|nr:rhomboid family intramembrane serine protease [Chitinophagaceae bacterium]
MNLGKRPLLGDTDNNLVIVIALNAFLFVILNFLRLFFAVSYDTQVIAEEQFQKQILHWFVLHANTSSFWHKPWTVLLYMFTNYSTWMLLSNVLWIWAFGYILQDLSGNRKLLPLYLYGGFFGALVYLLSANTLPYLQTTVTNGGFMIGGGAAVMAIAVATTTLAPDYRIFPLIGGGIPLWVLTVIFVAIDFGSMAGTTGSTAFAHLAGALVGFLYIKQLNKGKDLGSWMYQLTEWVNNLFNPEKKYKSSKQQHFYKVEKQPFEIKPNLTQQKLDAILDKINQKGYDLLTADEKDFLKRASKEEL